MLKTLEDVARELATDVTKLEIIDFHTKICWKDTGEIIARISRTVSQNTVEWIINTGDQT